MWSGSENYVSQLMFGYERSDLCEVMFVKSNYKISLLICSFILELFLKLKLIVKGNI